MLNLKEEFAKLGITNHSDISKININNSHSESIEIDESGNLKTTISSGPGEGEINSSSKSVEDIVIFKENEGKS